MTPAAAAGLWVAEALEPRRLHAADTLPGLGPAATLLSDDTATPATHTAPAELVVVDTAVAGSSTLLAALQAQQAAGRPLEILAIAPGDDGLAELGRALAGRADSGGGGFSAVHVLSHGSEGALQLGTATLDAASLLQRAGEVATWSAALTPDADLLLYGCDLAQGESGRALLQDLALLTGADVAASTDATGAAVLGGDWVLEASTGTIDAAPVLDAASAAGWQGTLAPQFPVNQTNPNLQITAAATRGSTQAVAADASGGFVVVWTSRSDVDGYDVRLRRFASDGTPLSADDLLVNGSTTAGDQQHASVAMAADGRFVVAWASSSGSTPAGIYVRRYDAAGSALGAEQRIDSGGGNATNPTVAMNRASGDFVVTWQGAAGSDSAGIVMRRFAADGTARDASPRLVNSSDRGNEAAPAVAMDGSGRFVVAWDVGGQVLFQRYAADGSAQGAATVVDAALSAGSGAAVAVDASGRFTIAWRDSSVLGLGLLGSGVWLRGFEADGSARTATLQVADGDATNASLAAHADGSVSVVYDRSGSNARDVWRQRLAADGTVLEAASVLNTVVVNEQVMPSAAALPRGSLVAVWSGYSDPGLGGDAQGVSAAFVGAVNHAPVVTSDGGGDSADLALAENLQAVTTVRASDADNDTLTYSLAGGADAARFTLDAATGALAFVTAPDFEAPADADGDNTYEVVVAVSDGLARDSQALRVRVTDIGGPLVVSTTADTADGATTSVEALLANPGADGAISLREALLAANATAGADRIEFSIGAGDVQTLRLAAALPQITGTVVIDGRTQPGTSSTPRIVLDGAAAGTDQTGLVFSTGSDGSQVRGLAIVGFTRTGITVRDGAGDITLAGNHLGVLADGLTRQANGLWGIDLFGAGSGVVIGGATAADGNVIAGGSNGGIAINGTPNATVQGNAIGVARDGSTALGGTVGVWVLNTTAGTRVLDNTIAYHQEGVVVQGSTARTTITGNRIYGHSDLGIDLGGDRSVLANDTRDQDVGANLGQNFPVITQAESDGQQLVIAGTLESVANTSLIVEVFASPTANASGYGEGRRVLGTVQVRTDSDGLASFSFALGPVAAVGEVVSATATRLNSSGVAFITSEFSRARTVTVNQAPVFSAPADGAVLTVAEGSTAVTTVRATDPEGTAVRYSLAGADAARFTIGASSGVLRFAAAPDFEAPGSASGAPSYQLELRATDARGLLSTRALVVALQDLDDNRPVVTAGQAFRVAEDTAAGTPVGTLLASDADTVGGPLTWALLGGNNGNAFALDAATGELRVANPTALDLRNGSSFTLTVAARDSVGASAAATVTVTLTPVNHAPDAGTTLPPLAAWEDEAFSATLPASAFTDRDGDTLTWALRQADGSALPTWLRFDAASRTLAGTPGAADIGTLSLLVAGSDANSASASQAFTLSVTNTNDAPTGRDATLTLAEDGTRVITLADLGFSDAADSPANAFASLQVVSLTGAGRWTLDGQAVSAGQSVTAANLAAGRFAFAPVADAHGSADAQLAFRVRDDGGTAHGGSDTDATVRVLTLDVTPVNDAPDAGTALPPLAAWEDEAFSATLPASAFTDRDGDTLTWALRQADGSALPAWLCFDAASRTLSGTPGSADIGTLSLRVTASDASSASASQAFTLSVTNTNDAPTGRDATLTLAEDASRVITLADLGFSDAADPSANAFASLQVVSLTGAGRWTLDGQAVSAGQSVTAADLAAGRFAFAPVADAHGSAYAQLGFRVRDDGGTAHGGSDTDATVRVLTLDVTPVNDAPDAGTALPPLAAWEDEAFSATLPASAFTDRDGDTLTWALRQADGSALPTWLRFDAASRTLSGTPSATDIGTLSLRVTASDASGASASQTLTLSVTNTNDAPTGRDATLTLAEDASRVITLADLGFSDTADPSANAFASLQVVSLTGAGRWTLDGQAVSAGQTVTAADLAAGRFAFAPVADANGSAYAQLGFRVRDDGGIAHGGSDTDATVRVLTLDVTPVDDAPQLLRNALQLDATPLATPVLLVADVDTAPAQLLLSASEVRGGHFERLADDGVAAATPVTQFTLADVLAGRVRFQRDDTLTLPDYRLAVRDARSPDGAPVPVTLLLAAQTPTPAATEIVPAASPAPSPEPVAASGVVAAPAAAAATPGVIDTATPVAAAAEVRTDTAALPEGLTPPALLDGTPLQRASSTGPAGTPDGSTPANAMRDNAPAPSADAWATPLAELPTLVDPLSPLVAGSQQPEADRRALHDGLAQLRDTLAQADDSRLEALTGGATVGAGLSVGYVVWLLRGGVLMSSMLAALPAWQLLDPLVLTRIGTGRRDERDDSDDVETLFSRSRRLARARAQAQAGDGHKAGTTAEGDA